MGLKEIILDNDNRMLPIRAYATWLLAAIPKAEITRDLLEIYSAPTSAKLLKEAVVGAVETRTKGAEYMVEALNMRYDYIEQTDPDLDVTDSGGTLQLPAGPVSLNVDGQVSVKGSFTLADDTQVIASQYGVELGRSSTIEVVAAEADSLVLTASEPWAWVGEDIEVTVEALDAYDNRADFSEAVTLSADSGSADITAQCPAPERI